MTGTCSNPTAATSAPAQAGAGQADRTAADRPTAERAAAELALLVPAAAAGDRRAFAELVDRYRPLVVQVARRYTDRPADAEDVVQEVWIKLWEHLGDLERPEALPGWLRRVTTNVAFRLQSRSGRLVLGDVDDVPAIDLTDDLGLRRTVLGDVRGVLDGALGRLKDSDRRLLELLMAEDRPDYRSVSRQVGRPVGSIGPTRQRIVQRLRRDPEVLRLAPGGVPVTAVA